MMDNNKPGMKNVDPNRPLIEGNKVQLRLVTLMMHPDYSLDKAFNGRGPIRANRNEELDDMPLVELLLDAKRRIEEEIDKGTRWAVDYGYAGFMTDSWERAIQQGLVTDTIYARKDYIDNNMYHKGYVALTRRRARRAAIEPAGGAEDGER